MSAASKIKDLENVINEMVEEAALSMARIRYYRNKYQRIKAELVIQTMETYRYIELAANKKFVAGAPPKDGMPYEVIVKDIFCIVRWRKGNSGEPKEKSIAYRCDCCGRIVVPHIWRSIPKVGWCSDEKWIYEK